MFYLPENLKKYRLLKNLTQEDVADIQELHRKVFQNGSEGFPELKDTTLKTHAYITSKQYNFGGKPYEKDDFLRI